MDVRLKVEQLGPSDYPAAVGWRVLGGAPWASTLSLSQRRTRKIPRAREGTGRKIALKLQLQLAAPELNF